VPRLQRLARFYMVPVDQLLPDDDQAGGAKAQAAARNGPPKTADPAERIRIDLQKLESLESTERELLSRYLTQIQRLRQDYNGKVLTIRREDLRAIACMFEITPDALERRLGDLGIRLPS
jgi:hypothetical protein